MLLHTASQMRLKRCGDEGERRIPQRNRTPIRPALYAIGGWDDNENHKRTRRSDI